MTKSLQEIDKLINVLATLGEDQDSLMVWKEIYLALPEEGQDELVNNFQSEIEQLKSLGGKRQLPNGTPHA